MAEWQELALAERLLDTMVLGEADLRTPVGIRTHRRLADLFEPQEVIWRTALNRCSHLFVFSKVWDGPNNRANLQGCLFENDDDVSFLVSRLRIPKSLGDLLQ